MTDVTLESPLVDIAALSKRELHADGRSCVLDEIALLDMLNLRGDAGDSAFVQGIEQATGLRLPITANSASIVSDRQLLWLGPDEWLLKVPNGQGNDIEARLRAHLSGRHISIVQVGSGNTTFSLQGPAAADLLSRGCPLDLHARAFPDGALAQSHIAKANATLYCVKAGLHYEITVRRSFADYLWRWLCEAGS